MPSGDDNKLQQSATEQAEDIIARIARARASREAALKQRAQRTVIRTVVTHVSPSRMELAAAPVAAQLETAGYLVAIGDSWFAYPNHNVLTNLDDHYGYNIESSAHNGDPIEAMVSHVGQFDKFTRNLDKVKNLGLAPKAVLVSGGGDDVAGNEFGMLINSIDLPDSGWNNAIVAGVLEGRIANAYRRMFLVINHLCQERFGRLIPILVHGYDYAVPDGRGFWGGWGPFPGPWLRPGFREKLFDQLPQTTTMMQDLIDHFNAMLQQVSQEAVFSNVHYIDLRGTLSNDLNNDQYQDWWANELHPTGADILDPKQNGFAAVAKKFEDVLQQLP